MQLYNIHIWSRELSVIWFCSFSILPFCTSWLIRGKVRLERVQRTVSRLHAWLAWVVRRSRKLLERFAKIALITRSRGNSLSARITRVSPTRRRIFDRSISWQQHRTVIAVLDRRSSRYVQQYFRKKNCIEATSVVTSSLPEVWSPYEYSTGARVSRRTLVTGADPRGRSPEFSFFLGGGEGETSFICMTKRKVKKESEKKKCEEYLEETCRMTRIRRYLRHRRCLRWRRQTTRGTSISPDGKSRF